MVDSNTGRMYYKISNWYYLLCFLPFHKKLISIWQNMLGVENKEYNDISYEISIFTNIKLKINFLKEFIHTRQNMEKLNLEFNKINKFYKEEIDKDLNHKEIISLYDLLEDKILKSWHVTLLNDLYAFIFLHLSLSKKDRENLKEVNNLESFKPLLAFRKLVKLYNDKQRDERNLEFNNEFNNFIELYGDRTLEELKLETKTFRTNPEILLKKIKTSDIDELNSYDKKDKENINEDLLRNKLKSSNNIFRKYFFKYAIVGIQNREISRLNRTRIWGMVRNMMLKIASNLKEENILDFKEDIFYLTIQEVKNIVQEKCNNFGGLGLKTNEASIKTLIQERKELYEKYKLIPPYNRMEFNGESKHRIYPFLDSIKKIKYSEKMKDLDKLIGQVASLGNIEGQVVVVTDANEQIDVKDKILVCKNTDPGWIYLVSQCKGLIVEKGSLLSHSAIITRELNKPCIVGVTHATEILENGMRVKMNTELGEITIIK